MLQIVDRWLQWKTSKENAKLVSFCFLLVVSSSLLENELDSWFCFDTQMMCVCDVWLVREIRDRFSSYSVVHMFTICSMIALNEQKFSFTSCWFIFYLVQIVVTSTLTLASLNSDFTRKTNDTSRVKRKNFFFFWNTLTAITKRNGQ